jgi:hypothetical protein
VVSRNLKKEEAIARVGPQRYGRIKRVIMMLLEAMLIVGGGLT